MGSLHEEYDVIVVGGGFGGTHTLNHLRRLGFHTHLYEAGAALGGVWFWNCYPGARVDVETPVYQLTAPELNRQWDWKERYAGRDEMMDYFQHMADVWDLKKDVTFNTRVQKAHWNKSASRWNLSIETETEHGPRPTTASCMDTYEGVMCHTGLWSKDIKTEGKRVAVIGTGASGVQFIQEVAPHAKELKLFQRTPNMALPMGQGLRDEDWNKLNKSQYENLVKKMNSTYAGFLYEFDPRKTIDVSEEERIRFFEELYQAGGGRYWLGSFSDILFDKDANDLAYEFWRQKTLQRLTHPIKAEKLAPKIAPHAFGTKRISLEQDYYEQFNKDHVDVIDMNTDDIETFTPKGIRTKSGEHEFDVICLATGFDSVTGGLTQIDIRSVDGTSIKDKWANGCWTHLGMTSSGFPNMSFIYGPQAPTAFATGPACAEAQADWIGKTLCYLRDNGYKSIDPKREAEEEWKNHVNLYADAGLFKNTKSWYFGDNIPGKARESLNYMAGMPLYRQKCAESRESG